MRKAFLYLSFLFLISNADARNNRIIIRENLVDKTYSLVQNDPITLVVDKFLLWYKKNYQKIKAIKLIPQDSGSGTVQYRVDFQAVDLYIKTLRSSSYLSDLYLTDMREYFETCDTKMLLRKQIEGPPAGLEGDLILLTQEVDDSLSKIGQKDLKFYPPIQKNDSATVCVELAYTLKFFLRNEAGVWKITKSITGPDCG